MSLYGESTPHGRSGDEHQAHGLTHTSSVTANERNRISKRVARASMTLKDRLDELASSKRRTQEHKSVKRVVNTVNSLVKDIKSTEARIFERCSKWTNPATSTELVCSVCDCLHPSDLIQCKDIEYSSSLLSAMKARLTPPPNLPESLRVYYDASAMHQCFNCMLLSKAGIILEDQRVKLQICTPCLQSLSNKKLSKPPKFAIANGLYIGSIPSVFDDTTLTENAMLNLSQPTHFFQLFVVGSILPCARTHTFLEPTLRHPQNFCLEM